MTDRLDLAYRRYDQLRPAPGVANAADQARALSLWLERDVGAVVDDLVGRTDFRALARWPIERLRPKAASAERALVEEIDAGLVECACRLVESARRPAVSEALRRLGPRNEWLPEAHAADQASSSTDSHGSAAPFGLEAVEFLGRRPWRDLVIVHDYFYPVGDLNLSDRSRSRSPDGVPVQLAEFLPYFNPDLRQPGDFVSRTLLLRVAHWECVLQRGVVRCQAALRNSGQDGGTTWAAAVEASGRLHERSQRLRDICLLGPEARQRNAVIAMVQVYADYRPRAALDWLGLPSGTARPSCGIRDRVERRHDLGVAELVAAVLLDMAPLYRTDEDPTAMLEARYRSHRLVLVMGRGRREVYWQGQLVEVDWFVQKAPWDLLAALVEGVRSGRGVDTIDVLGEEARGSLKDRRSRLKRLVPTRLDEAIGPAGRGAYKLNLRPEEVCLLEYEGAERLAECYGGAAEDRDP